MTTYYDVKAYAKINLFLRVCGSCDNGYHRLYMLMNTISLSDDIRVQFDENEAFSVNIDSGMDIPREEDLCYKAARAFLDHYEAKLKASGSKIPAFPRINITAKKNIPSQAGLGGGSSDAAAVLKVLQKHFDYPMADDELIKTAVKLGADVPFFLKGGSFICEGIGEILTPLPDLSGINILLVKPEDGVSTGLCYKLSDEMTKSFDEEEYKRVTESVFKDGKGRNPKTRIKDAAKYLTNDLQKPASVLLPVIYDINEKIKESGAFYAAMTGSGSCLFGIYEDMEKRDEAFKILKKDPVTSCCQIIPAVLI